MQAVRAADSIARHIAEADVCLGIFGDTTKTGRVLPFKIYSYASVGRAIVTGDTACMRELLDDYPGQVFHTVPVADAEALKPFYEQVVGWTFKPHPMGEYDDYEVQNASGETVAGICNQRGTNRNAPPQWLLYVEVEDVDAAAARCTELGGEVVDGPRMMGNLRFAAVRDPQGAFIGLVRSPDPATEEI